MSTEDNNNTAARIIADLAAKAAPVQHFEGPDGRRYVILRSESGRDVLSEITVEGRLPLIAEDIVQRVTVTSKQSAIEYITEFKTASTRLFADLGSGGRGATLKAILDYHKTASGGAHIAGRKAHVLTFTLQDSEEWTRWSKISGQLMSQPEFVRFLEENSGDIENPSGAEILELATDFSAARKVNFQQGLRTQTGETSFEYIVEAEGKSTKHGHVNVPNMFQLRIPVFYGESSMEVRAFLRWSIDDGSLKMGIQLHRPVYVKQALFEQIGLAISEAVGAPLHYGSDSNS